MPNPYTSSQQLASEWSEILYDSAAPGASATEMRVLKAQKTRKHKAWERAQLTALLATGCGDKLDLHMTSDNKVWVSGKNIQRLGNIMFIMDNDSLTMHTKRSKHLKDLLLTLAEQQGLELVEVSELSGAHAVHFTRLAFIDLKTRQEVDDSAIMAAASIASRNPAAPLTYNGIDIRLNDGLPF